MSSVKFSSELLKTDVTAIKIINNITLVGIGGDLHIFENLKYVSRQNLFEGENILGICLNLNQNLALINTGLKFKILSLENDFNEISSKNLHDWILTSKWIENDKIAVILMHNVLHILNDKLETVIIYKCEENCILYSAFIKELENGEFTVFSGTVFNEILIWKTNSKNKNILQRLKGHKGVIFSIDYNQTYGYLCTTSDDRSAILWKLNEKNSYEEISKIQVYGHSSRIFRCKIRNDSFITSGEDCLINIWSFEGELVRKIETHRGGPLWALDCDENNIYSGGNDSGVTVYPIRTDIKNQQLVLPNLEAPKHVGVLASNNLVVLSESGSLFYFLRDKNHWITVAKIDALKSYALMQISNCRKLISLSGYNGEIFVYKETTDCIKLITSDQCSVKSRIYSFHWISCRTFLICQRDGIMTLFLVKNNKIIPTFKFLLPLSKERWTTTAVGIETGVIVGNRKGDVFVFKIGELNPIQIFKKIHNHLGVTKLITKNNCVISLGKDGTIKNFVYKNGILTLISTNKVKFAWLLDYFDDLIVAFSSNNFIIWHDKTKYVIFEKHCGGGHRSWDLYLKNNDTTFVYVKDKQIHLTNFDLTKSLPLDLIQGYHAREINAIEIIKNTNEYFLISGGEDTIIRVSVVKKNVLHFNNILVLKSHLSSIRTITSYKLTESSYLLFSAGGRAQIICWKLNLEIFECSEQFSYYQTINNLQSEMRIMDLQVENINESIILFCACSDGNIKLFNIELINNKYCLTFLKDISYKLKCITKLTVVKNSLITMATDGFISFWNLPELKLFDSIKSNQSGINSYCFKFFDDNCLFITGGDDNAIVINLISISENNVTVLDKFVDVGTHCAQITGAFLYENFLITASIDQRVAVFKIEINDDHIQCQFVDKYNTSVSDVQGLQCFYSEGCFDCFIYGNGVELIKIAL